MTTTVGTLTTTTTTGFVGGGGNVFKVANATTDYVGFYGVAPIQQTNALLTNVNFTAITSTGTTASLVGGFVTLTQASSIIGQVIAINAALVGLGLIVL
jgi:hypothetical protein